MALRENTFYDTVTIAVVIDDTATIAAREHILYSENTFYNTATTAVVLTTLQL